MNLSIKIKKENLKKEFALILMMIPFFQPGCFLYMSVGSVGLSLVFNLLKIVITVVFFATHGLSFNNLLTKKSALLISITFFGAFISISNFIHSNNVIEFATLVSFFSFCYMCQYYFKKDMHIFFSALVHLFALYNILQIITVILYYPNGIFNYTGAYWAQTLARAKYFFGGKNQAIFYMLALLVCFMIKAEMEKKKYFFKNIVISIAFLCELYVLDGGASMICLIVFQIMVLLANNYIRRFIRWAYNPYIILVISFAFFLIVCVAGQANSIPLLSQFLAIFGRNTTFTNRIYIWANALNFFISSPLLGVGELSFYVTGTEITQAHNMYLDIMYKYGLFAIISYVIALVISAKSLHDIAESKGKYILSALFFIMLVHNCVDAMDNYMFVLLANIFAFAGLNQESEGINEIAR